MGIYYLVPIEPTTVPPRHLVACMNHPVIDICPIKEQVQHSVKHNLPYNCRKNSISSQFKSQRSNNSNINMNRNLSLFLLVVAVGEYNIQNIMLVNLFSPIIVLIMHPLQRTGEICIVLAYCYKFQLLTFT